MTEPGTTDEIVRRTSVDGTTVFWTPKAERVIGSLQFRVGRGDEAFPQMGISHLVEHLALFPIGRRPYGTNGFVDHARTVFHAQGTIDEVCGFLGEVCVLLQDLPLDRLTDESRILAVEARSRTPSISEHLLFLRYGAAGYGALTLPESGLGTISATDVTAWAASRFTADNAVMWLSAEPSADLRLPLPRGTYRPPIESVPIQPMPLPAWVMAHLPGIALGVIVPRDSPTTMGLRILTNRLEQRLRYELGKSYEVSLAYTPLDGSIGHGSVFASCIEADAPAVRDAFIEVLGSFLASGPTETELRDDVDGFRRGWEDPSASIGELERTSFNTLLGHPLDSPASLLEEMSAVTTLTARDACEAAFRSAILTGPVMTPVTGSHWHQYAVWSTDAVTGRTYDVVTRRYPWSKRPALLVVGDEGVSWSNVDGQTLTVRYEDCVGVLAGAGVRTLWGRDGFSIRIVAADWRGGTEAVSKVDAAIPRRLVVQADPFA